MRGAIASLVTERGRKNGVAQKQRTNGLGTGAASSPSARSAARRASVTRRVPGAALNICVILIGGTCLVYKTQQFIWENGNFQIRRN